ncbi:antibiotic ABC transporter [Cognatishimia sp. SS12]|nr:antibiotic ABC transporter [Cognatishimia sp. SS12]
MMRMASQAQAIILLRSLGMIGLLPAERSEACTMVLEKVNAFGESWCTTVMTATAGRPADEVFAAALGPYQRATSENFERLTQPVERDLT